MRALAGAVFGMWGTVNHYLTFWPRLQVALVVAVMLAAALAAGIVLLQRVRPARLRVGRLVFAGTFLLMAASGGGHLYTPDEWTIYAAAVGLVEHGVPAAFMDEPYPLHLLSAPLRPPGTPEGTEPRMAYSKYGVLPTLLAAPLYAVGRVTGPGPELPAHAFPYGNRALPLVPLVLGPLIAALAAAALFDLARALGYGTRAALVAVGGLAFGSLAWPFSKTLMNMPLAAACLLGALWAIARTPPADVSRRPARWLVLTGALLGAAIATRYETVLFCAPLIALALRGGARGEWTQWARRAGWLTLGLAAVVVPLVFGMNLLRTGSVLDAGYGGEGGLSTLAAKPWYGLFGILLSPGCGLVTHTPLMALGLVGMAWLWEDAPAHALAAGAIVLLAILYYGSLSTWCGYSTWGPRYLATVGPFMALPLAALWSRLRRFGRNPFLWLVGGGLFLWSAGMNLLAVLIDFNRGWQDHWGHGVTYLEVTWLPYFTGPVAHYRLLMREWLMDGIGGLDLYLWHVPLGPLWVGLLVAAGLACWGLAWRSGYAEAPPPSTSTSL